MKFVLSLLGVRPIGIKRSHPFFTTLNHLFSFYSVRYALGLVVASLILFGYSKTESGQKNPHIGTVKKVVSTVFDPVIDTLNKPINGVKNVYEFLNNHQKLINQNQELSEKLAEHDALKMQYKILKQEYNLLLSSNNINIAPENVSHIYRVSGVRFTSYSENLYVNITDSVLPKTNSYVFGVHGVVGRVVVDTTHNPVVMLITDSRSRIPVRHLESGEQAILSGVGNNKLRLIHDGSGNSTPGARAYKKVEVGDIYVTSSFGNIYPDNIPVGKVISYDGENITLEPLENFQSLRFVRIGHVQ
jgi:rod shape-determining protein MreC